MKKTVKKVLYALFAAMVLAGLGVAGYYLFAKPAAPSLGPTLVVGRGELIETASANGTIEPRVQVEVKSRASGAVTKILVEEGQHVDAGQLLVELDPTDAERDLATAKVTLEKVKADISASNASLAVAALDRKNSAATAALAEKTAGMGLGSTDAVRTARYSAEVADANVSLKGAQLASAKTQLKSAELTVQDAETRLKETKIYAPMAGTVLDIAVEKGTIVTSALTSVNGGTSVMTVADLTDLRIVGAIDEARISQVVPKQVVEIRVDAYPDRVFKGVVEKVSPLGKTTSSVVTFDVEIGVVDENASLLRSGMSADVEIVTKKEQDVLLVPLIAVQSSGRVRVVRLANGQKREIKTGGNDGTNMVVLEGLSEGDVILATTESETKKTSSTSGQKGGMGVMGGPPPGGGR